MKTKTWYQGWSARPPLLFCSIETKFDPPYCLQRTAIHPLHALRPEASADFENKLENNIIELSLDINEGDASTIKEIKILGNKTYSTRLLKSLIKSGPKYWFEVWSDKDIYNSTLLDQDIEVIRDYYLDRGYAKFKVVSKQVNLSPDKEDIYITLSLNEGNLYKFGKTTVYGLDNFDSNIFKNIINYKKNRKISDV